MQIEGGERSDQPKLEFEETRFGNRSGDLSGIFMAWVRDFFRDHIVSGAAYGATAVALSHPFDTLKTRQQTFGSGSPLTTIGRTVRSEGVLSFYRGFVPALSGYVFRCVRTKSS